MNIEPILDIFNNIDAQEWWQDLEDSLGFILLSNTIETAVVVIETEEFLGITLCYQTLIAVELWLALRGCASAYLPVLMQAWLERNQHLYLSPEIDRHIKKTISTIQCDSELQQLWQASIHYAQWLAQLEEMKQRIDHCLQDSN